jgi:energy-converting hydrogenase B subunit D
VTGLWILDYLCIGAIVASALLVVRLPNLNSAVIALSAATCFMALLFIVLGAPDDAHAEVVVGTIALPVLYFVAIGKARTAVRGRATMSGEEDETQR